MSEPRIGNPSRVDEEDADEERLEEEDEAEIGRHPLHISQVSAGLRAALAQAPVGLTGMRSVRAIGPEGQRFTAGLYGDDVFLLELPWPNPRNECRSLYQEPLGVQWQVYSPETRSV